MKKIVTKKSLILILALCLCVCLLCAMGCDLTPKFTITFDTGVEGMEIEPITAAAGEQITAPTNPERENYRFDGWARDGELFSFDVMPETDVTLVAVWTRLYTVTFDTGAGQTVPSARYAEGETVLAPENPIRAGHMFLGWLLDGEPYEFGEMPTHDITLVADWLEISNLPAMFVELYDEDGGTFDIDDVTREEYVDSVVTLTNTSKEFELDSLKASFKGRGNGSWKEFKKCYKIKFDKKQSLFGHEKNKHWVLIACANYDDVTMSRNYLAYNMVREVLDGIEYTTPAYWIDLFVNGDYRGVYLLCEHVRVGEGRVDIESEYGVDDTGYLIEYDGYAKGVEGVDYFRIGGIHQPFTVHSPDPEEYESEGGITTERYRQQVAYIQNYVARVFYAALIGDFATFAELADVDSFVDMYILHELFKNVDTGWSSFYLYKKPSGKLYAGPAWDFDGTTNISDPNSYAGDRSPEGIFVASQSETRWTCQLYVALYNTYGFQQALRARWQQLSPEIVQFLDKKLNDEVYETNRVAMGRNFLRWKWWVYDTRSAAEKDWVDNVKALKQWMLDRIAWLDKEWYTA